MAKRDSIILNPIAKDGCKYQQYCREVCDDAFKKGYQGSHILDWAFTLTRATAGWVCGKREPISCPIYRFPEEKKDSEKIEELLREYIENKWGIKI